LLGYGLVKYVLAAASPVIPVAIVVGVALLTINYFHAEEKIARA
jgi:1-acyl-sn-glycerol-3-phosphate acyltransferase